MATGNYYYMIVFSLRSQQHLIPFQMVSFQLQVSLDKLSLVLLEDRLNQILGILEVDAFFA
jgi:hypothetical protein